MKKTKRVQHVPNEQFDQHMRTLVEQRVSPSLAVTAVRGGEELSTEGHEMPQRIGLGWHLAGSEETRSCYHLGGGAGYRSEVRIYPQLGYGIGVMGNETSYDTRAITSMIVSAQANKRGETDLARQAQEGGIS